MKMHLLECSWPLGRQTERDCGTLPARVGGRHYMLTRDNVESGRLAFLDGPRVGDLGGGYMY